MAEKQVDEVSSGIMRAAEQYAVIQGISLTQKRLLYEFLAYPGKNGKTLSGLSAEGVTAKADAAAELLYITRRWMGVHIIKHYYVMRQYRDASTVVLGFLKYLKSEGTLPAKMAKELDAAIEVGEQGVEQLPHIMRIVRQPCARNEAYSRVYPLRPFPLCTVPTSTEVKDSSSRHWPSTTDQVYHAWLSYASERCRVDIEELESIVQAVPKKLTIVSKVEGRWEVISVNPDSSITFRQYQGTQEYTIPFSEKRAGDFLPGMLMIATFVTLSDGTQYVTDWGYVYPTFYAPAMDHAFDFGPNGNVQLVY